MRLFPTTLCVDSAKAIYSHVEPSVAKLAQFNLCQVSLGAEICVRGELASCRLAELARAQHTEAGD